MRNLFTKECLSIQVGRTNENNIVVSISSDYSGSSRKSELHVNENRLAEAVESFWKSTKTKKLLKMSVSFNEIDWYDDEVDVYETPIVHIERGLKKAKIKYNRHGSIPKDWSVDVYFKLADTTTNTPILEVVKSALGSNLDSNMEKELVKQLKPLLQKKVNRINVAPKEMWN